MGCWEPNDPADEFKDWSKGLVSDEEKTRYAELLTTITEAEVLDAVQEKTSMPWYDESDIGEFKEDYPQWHELLLTEIAYNKLFAEQQAVPA